MRKLGSSSQASKTEARRCKSRKSSNTQTVKMLPSIGMPDPELALGFVLESLKKAVRAAVIDCDEGPTHA